MAHVSLYRKYRPQTFAEVVGQDHVTTTLANAIAEDRLHHAYLFTGPRGTGKTSTARILAKAVNCVTGPTATPCGSCEHCVHITEGASIDVIEIDAASHGGVDDVRDLRERVAFAPASARLKVYIVDECHMLSTAGWNAFLKTVEEPPGHVLFVFATTEPHKVLATILSRTQRFDFKRVGAEILAAHVNDLAGREGLDIEQAAIDVVVRAGDGSVRDTLSVLDQVVAFSGSTVTLQRVLEVLGTVDATFLSEAVGVIADGDVGAACALVGRLADAGHDLRQFAKEAVEHLRRLLLLQVAPDADLVEGTPEELAALRAQAQRLGRVELLRAVELLADAQAQMRRGNTRLPLEVALIKAALPEASADPAALAARMDRLERRTGVEHAPAAVDPQAPTTPAPPEPQVASQPPAPPQDASADSPQDDVAQDEVAQDDLAQDDVAQDDVAQVSDAAQDAVPQATAPADPPPEAPAAAPVDTDLVTSSWPAVVAAVKARSRRLEAFLTPARPVGISDGVLELEFGSQSRFHAEQCASEEWQGALSEVFAEVLGKPLRVRCRVLDSDGPAVVRQDDADEEDPAAADVLETEAAEAAGELPDDEEAHSRAIEALTRDLGATVVEE